MGVIPGKYLKILHFLLMPFIFIAMTIRSLDVARAYDIVQMMTGGGPAKRTKVIMDSYFVQ